MFEQVKALFNTIVIGSITIFIIFFIAGGNLDYQEWNSFGRFMSALLFILAISITYSNSLSDKKEKEDSELDEEYEKTKKKDKLKKLVKEEFLKKEFSNQDYISEKINEQKEDLKNELECHIGQKIHEKLLKKQKENVSNIKILKLIINNSEVFTNFNDEDLEGLSKHLEDPEKNILTDVIVESKHYVASELVAQVQNFQKIYKKL